MIAIIVVLLAVTVVVGYRYEARQVRGRTRRHLESGGKIGDAPDMLPPHGGGSGGG